jgi:ribose transport system ATP-binding protein
LFKTIKRLKKKSVSVIYISHRLNELFEIGDRVTVLRDGKHITTKTISNTTEQDLIRMMVARELKEQYPRQSVSPGREVIRIENLNVRDVLKNINFSIRKGEIVGIAGLLGAGRTELARALFGVDKIKHGQIIIHGIPEKINSPRKAINLKMGFLTEDRKRQGLVLNLSLKDNICLPSVQRFSRLGIVSVNRENEAAKKYVREFQIKTPGLYQKTMYLSGGNQQKVVMSKWLCTEADILIFDEPTRGIDVGSKVEIYKLMNDLTAGGVAILMISSDLPEILGMSDRILVMHNGRITAEYTSQEATQEKILQSALGAA